MPLPSLPEKYVPRLALLATVRSLVTGRPLYVADRPEPAAGLPVAGSGPVVGLVGMGGSGKSTLARALLVDPVAQESFPDGSLWVDVGQNPDLASILTQLSSALGDPDPVADVAAGRERLRRLLATGRRLLVLDNVWDADALQAFEPGLPMLRILVTTRSREVLPEDALIADVATLDDEQARAVVASHAGIARSRLPPDADGVLAGCGGLVLALAVAGGMIADGVPWADVTDRLRHADLAALTTRFAGYPYPDLLRALDAGVAALPGESQDRYRELAVFCGRGPVPPEAVIRLWRATAGLGEAAGKELLNRLARRSLVALDADAVTLHDLAFDHLRTSLPPGQLPRLHARFAGAFLADWGGLAGGLAPLRERDTVGQPDRYALGALVGHLAEAGLDDELHALLAAQWPGPGGTAENAWFVLHERADLPGSYLADIRAAWARAAASGNAAAARNPAEATDEGRRLALALRYALMHIHRERVPLLARLAPHLPAADRAAAIAEAWRLMNERPAGSHDPTRARVIATLAPHLGGDLLAEAVEVAATIDWGQFRVDALAALAPHLTDALADRALAAAAALDHPPERARAIDRLAPYLPTRLLTRALAITQTVEPPLPGAAALTQLASQLPTGPRATVLAAALGAAGRVEAPAMRAFALANLAPQLDQALLDRALATARTINEPAARVKALTGLLPHLPAGQRAGILAEAWDIAQGTEWPKRADLLVDLAPHLPEDLLAAAVEAASSVPSAPLPVLTALAALAERLAAPARRTALLPRLEDIRGLYARTLLLVAVAPALTEAERHDRFSAALDAMAAASEPMRAVTLEEIAKELPADLFGRAIELATGIEHRWGQAQALGGLAPYLPVVSVPVALEAALSVAHPGGRGRAIAALAPRLPAELARRAFNAALAVDSGHGRSEAVAGLAPHLPEDLLPAAAEAARRDSSTQAAVAVAAAAREQRSAYWDGFRADTLADLARASHGAARSGRGELIGYLPTMLGAAPVGTDPAAVAAATVDALVDVLRWWP